MAEEQQRQHLSPEGDLPRKKRRGGDGNDSGDDDQEPPSPRLTSCFRCGKRTSCFSPATIVCPHCGAILPSDGAPSVVPRQCPHCKLGIAPVPAVTYERSRSKSPLKHAVMTIFKVASSSKNLCDQCKAAASPPTSPVRPQQVSSPEPQPSTSGAHSQSAQDTEKPPSSEPQPSTSGVSSKTAQATPKKSSWRRSRSRSKSAEPPKPLKSAMKKLPEPEIMPYKEVTFDVSSRSSYESSDVSSIEIVPETKKPNPPPPKAPTPPKGPQTVLVKVDVHHDPSPVHQPGPSVAQADDNDDNEAKDECKTSESSSEEDAMQ